LVAILPLSAQQFRIETALYHDNEQQPSSRNLTLFSDGVIYDFQLSDEVQSGPLEITIFDSRKRVFSVLDVQRQIQMHMDVAQLVKIVEGLRNDTAQNQDARFLVTADFSEEFNSIGNWVSLVSPEIEYRCTGQSPKDVAILPTYFEFLDYYTMLNATDPKRLPPFCRMRLNQTLEKYGWIPSEIQMIIRENSLFPQGLKATTKHTLIHHLSDLDRDRIAAAKNRWMTFEQVNLARYRGFFGDQPIRTEPD
jgi:uncharacterized protein YeeX (DUF496 family)